MIVSIFNVRSPLHDGAAVVEGSRIARAGVVLPLTQQDEVPAEYGTRHRAAMGLAERSDAICVVVSEERGEVSVMLGRGIMRMRSADDLASFLENALERQPVRLRKRVRDLILSHGRLKLASAGLAALIWSVTLFDTGSTVRVLEVPVEFQNVPPGLDVASPSATELSVQLRGRTWLMNSNQMGGLIAHIDLRGAQEGLRAVAVSPQALDLPPGLSMMHVNPNIIQLHLVKRDGKPSAR